MTVVLMTAYVDQWQILLLMGQYGASRLVVKHNGYGFISIAVSFSYSLNYPVSFTLCFT
jgi:hypothetical protein